jgi:RNA polymerase sigma factor (sigma-70 family)
LEQPRQHSKLTDEELLLAYKTSSNNEWLGYLLQRYTMLLFGVAMKYLKDKEQAHDAVQQVFLKVLGNMHGEEFRNFKGWLYVLMRNHCLQLLRDTHHKAGEDVLLGLQEQATEDKEDIAWREYSIEQMKQAMAELNEEQRTSIVQFYLEKKSYQQIMEYTGFSFLQVKSYVQNGKRNLKAILLKKLGRRG